MWEGMARSRAWFENQPDRGIFGKSFSRFFNYIEVYFFRMIFTGIFFVGIVKFIVAVLNVLLSIFLGITGFLWIPVTLSIRATYHLLIWDFDSPTRKGWTAYPAYDVINHSFERFPLIVWVLQLILGLIQIALSLLSIIVIHPTLTLLAIVRAYARNYLSRFTDKFMSVITRKIGR